MKVKTLLWNKVARMTLFALLLIVTGTMKAIANNDNHDDDAILRANYDFSSVCETGQTLYYKITNPALHYVKLVHPNSSNDDPWISFVEPTGAITLPETVSNNNITYTVTAIGNHTFNKCHGLIGSLVIPSTITDIEQFAFANCDHFTSLTLNEGLEIIGPSAFFHCGGFTGSLIIPNSVVSIGHHAFSTCSGFNGTLSLSEGLQKIEYRAFEECSGFIGSLIIPNSVTSVGQYAFLNCSSFNGELKLPDDITWLQISVFKGCSGFVGDLVIPRLVNRIGNEAFANCTSFSAIYICSNSVPSKGTENNSFTSISSNIPIYVPYCLVSDYTSQWSVFGFTNYKGRSFFNADGDWSNVNNWACGSLPEDNLNVVVAANCNVDETANITSATLLKGYTLSIMPEAALTSNTITNKGTAANLVIQEGGELYHNNTGVQATVLRSITAYSEINNPSNGWHLIASPLEGSVSLASVENLLSNNYDLYYYHEPTYYWINQKEEANNFTTLESSKGYIYANNEETTLGFAGVLKKGNETVTVSSLTCQGEYLTGFHLIGNPYAHNVTSYASENVAEEGCFRMNSTKDDLIVSEISEDSPLKPAEGFFILAENEDASITFGNAKTRDEVKKTGSIVLDLSENGQITDRLIVKRSEEDKDFTKLSLRDNRTKLFASKENQELAIVVCNANEQPVDFKAAKNSSYTINVTVNDLDVEYLHLIDNLTGENIDLLATPSYTFNARTTDYASRFRLVFDPFADDDTNENFAFISDGNFIIANEGVATLQVIDVTGRILSSETIRDSFTKPVTLSNGVYILRLVNGNDVKSQKIVVR